MPKAPDRYRGTIRQPARARNTKVYGRRWRKFRDALLDERLAEAMIENVSVCVECRVRNKQFRASDPKGWPWELHHIVPISERPDLMYEPTNIEVLCKADHRARENQQKAS